MPNRRGRGGVNRFNNTERPKRNFRRQNNILGNVNKFPPY